MGRRAVVYFVGYKNNCPLGHKKYSFNLAFRSDAIMPIEVGTNSFQVAHFDSRKNETSIRANLDL